MSLAAERAGASRGVEDRSERLRRIRRLDWRFLLPEPRLRRVGWFGPVSGGGPEDVRPFAAAVAPVRGSSGGLGPRLSAGCDQLAVRCARPSTAADLCGALVPGGSLYCELPRRGQGRTGLPIAGRALSPWRAALRRAGMVDVRAYLHYPSFETSRWIVPLDDTRPLVFLALRNRGPVATGIGRALRPLADGRLVARFAPCISLVARREGGAGGASPASPFLLDALPARARPEGSGAEAPAWLIASPRFRASGHVLFLFLDREGSAPALVVKVARLPDTGASLDREAEALRVLARVRPGGLPGTPRLVARGRAGEARFLAETGLPGRTLNPERVRRRPDTAADALVSWLLELGRATASRAEPAVETCRRVLDEPLERFERLLPLNPEERALVARTRELTSPLRTPPPPARGPGTVFEHGDVSSPNLLLSGDGVGVVDWELAEPRGLPTADLFFFLAFLSSSRRRARSLEEQLEAFHADFFAGATWATRHVARYAEALEIAPRLLAPLFIATWCRQTLAMAGRVAGEEDARLSAETLAWLRAERRFAFWRHAVRHHDRLRLGGGA